MLAVHALMLGRLARFVPLSRLRDLDLLGAAPRLPRPLEADAWQRLAGSLSLV